MNWWILKRRLHPSWYVAILSITILMGVYLAGRIEPTTFSSVSWLLSGLIITVVIFWRRYIYLIPFVIIAGLLIGLWRGSLQGQDLQLAKQMIGRDITVTGKVKEDADTNSRGQLALRLGDIKFEDIDIPGAFWATVDGRADIKRGDIVTVKGQASEGFGSFAVTIYSSEIIRIQRPEPGDIARVVRDWFASKIHDVIPDPEASLGIGYLVGQKRALPTDLVLALQIAGLTHVVVASGYNLTILVRLARRLFEKVSKYLSALMASTMIFAFIAVTGLSPSMSRAGLVASLSLLAWYYGRKFHPLVLLPVAAVVTVLANPSYIWGDLGWQLSFAAFAGVMVLAPLLQQYFFADRKPSSIRQILIETSSAFIITAPILISTFGQISNISIVANLLVLPLVPLAMLLTFIAGIGSILIPALAVFIALPANWLLGYMVNVSEYLSKLPWATSSVELNGVGVALCYTFISAICIYMWRVTRYNLRDSNVVE